MGKLKKIILGIIGTIIVLLIFIVVLSYFLLKKTLPEYDGNINVKGLNSEVTILRDSFAIPMITAQNDEDAAYALGYVHAQERLFQMDVEGEQVKED